VALLVIHNQFAQLQGDFPEEAVRQATSYLVPGARFTRRYQEKRADGTRRWDGRRHLFLSVDNLLPAGLVEAVLSALRERGVPVAVQDLTDYPPPRHGSPEVFDLPGGGALRDYQREGIRQAIVRRRGILKIATGGGKTVLAAGLIAELGLPTLVVVDSKDLLHQTRAVLARHLRRDIGLCGDGQWHEAEVTVATVASLGAHLHGGRARALLKRSKLLLADEVHHGASDSAFRVLMGCPAPYRIGLSATPTGRSDNADLKTVAAIGPVIYEVSARELIEAGVLVRPIVEFVPIEEPPLARSASYKTVYRLGVVECEARNHRVVARAGEFHARGDQTLILVRELEHGRCLLRMLGEAGVSAEFICGEGISSDQRRCALDRFRSGALRCLVASEILDEAIDLPNIDALLLAGGGKSEIQTIQRIGRGMRTGKRATVLSVVDFADMTHRYLARHSLERLRTYRREGVEIHYQGKALAQPLEA
jgi:superfamily II DNA or RNA helicase